VRPLQTIVALLAAALCSACGEGARTIPGPLDRFTYPTGITLAPLQGGAGRALVVVSSNFDLRYSPDQGGSVIAVNPDLSTGDTLSILGAARIGSFGGEVAVVTPTATPGVEGGAAAPATCANFAGAQQVLVPSRGQNALYRVGLDSAGGLSCGPGCFVPLNSSLADPYGVAVACRPVAGGIEATAYVSHLRVPQEIGYLSRLDLVANALSTLSVNVSPVSSFAWDTKNQRLFFTGRFGALDLAALRWIDPAFSETLVHEQNFGTDVRGSELRSIALSSPGAGGPNAAPRAYIAVRLFNRDVVTSVGVRPADVSGALAVVDLTDLGAGPTARLVRLVPVGVGPNQVIVMPRGDGRRDVVAISNTDEGTLVLYDDDTGGIAAVVGTVGANLDGDPFKATVKRTFGRQPFGLASEAKGASSRRIYVGSFDRGFVTALDVDLNSPSSVSFVRRFGPEVPNP
jgi:hypothetical protein